jgi:formylglycine-generating enzyme required for sulfatase activity
VRLPTEQERQRAALGDDGRRYPWETKTNKELGQTMVGHDPSEQLPDQTERQPYGLYNMAGNGGNGVRPTATGNQDVHQKADSRVVWGGVATSMAACAEQIATGASIH